MLCRGLRFLTFSDEHRRMKLLRTAALGLFACNTYRHTKSVVKKRDKDRRGDDAMSLTIHHLPRI